MRSDHGSTGGPGAGARARGFTLLEVMVALVVTSIGLLGIAKLQALAYASTGSASVRSLVALQAAGLAASMHANRGYWTGNQAAPITITGTVISDNTLATTAGTPTCLFGPANTPCYCQTGSGNTPCSTTAIASADVQTYAAALNAMLGNSSPITTITCPAPAVIGSPVSCSIQVTWNEKAVSLNTQSAANTTQATFAPTYTLYVEP
jgi:type IV pilus assembly protein PilV